MSYDWYDSYKEEQTKSDDLATKVELLESELRGGLPEAYAKKTTELKKKSDEADAERDHKLERSLTRWTPQRCSLWGGALASIVAVEAFSGLAWLLFF